MKSVICINNFESYFESYEEGMRLVDEIDYGLPWPSFEEDTQENPRIKMNTLVFEHDLLFLVENYEYKLAMKRLKKIEEAKIKVRKMIAERTAYVRRLIRLIFKGMTNKLNRKSQNYYSRILTSVICLIGFNETCKLEVRVALFAIAYLTALLSNN